MASCAILALVSGLTVFAQDEVKIDSGTLRGVSQNGVVSFKGIPFAAPPVGNQRWKPPQPVQSWTGVRPAAEFGSDCMQAPFEPAPYRTKTTPSEDCLFVNVWTPSITASPKLPVMVWIYGGGYMGGATSGPVYDGAEFAKLGVVFVSLNYRLGRLGFFGHPALTAESPNGPLGNYGFMDQIAALKWVQQNIAPFGGDPKKVTLFGESAGGGSVLAMMTAPMAQGLFQQAIIESSPVRDPIGGPAQLKGKAGFLSKPTGESAGLAFAKSKGISGTDAAALDALRKLPPDTIVDGLNMMTMFQALKTYVGPMVDGVVIVESAQAAFLAGHQAKIPVIAGATNRDLGFQFARTMPEVMAPFGFNQIRAYLAYDPNHTNNVKIVGAAVASDQLLVEPMRFVVRQVVASGQPSYEYRFSYVGVSERGKLDGAGHGAEIPYVFDTVKAFYGDQLNPADSAMAATTISYWVAFAKTGDPNGEGRPHWPAYSPQTDILLDFTNTGAIAGPDPWKTRLDLTEKVAGGHP
ncbi:MAG TPA: carboxylesterase family protein [Silvibacterium sp.]|nr:carboxylesterase family protein [Silvibacterium sp.]